MKKMLLAAGALLAAGLAQTSCQAPAAPAPKAEPIDAVRPPSARKPTPAQPNSEATPARKVVLRTAPLFPAGAGSFREKPHLRKVKYGKHRWILV